MNRKRLTSASLYIAGMCCCGEHSVFWGKEGLRAKTEQPDLSSKGTLV
jgi:hypothetical protein